MKKEKKPLIYSLMWIIAIAIPLLTFEIYKNKDYANIWNTWGPQENGTIVLPDVGNYLLLINYKFSIYFYPVFILFFGFYLLNKEKIIVRRDRIIFNVIKSFGLWFLALIILKTLIETIFELDALFGIVIFSGVKEVQALVGYIISLIISKPFELKEGIQDKKLIKKL